MPHDIPGTLVSGAKDHGEIRTESPRVIFLLLISVIIFLFCLSTNRHAHTDLSLYIRYCIVKCWCVISANRQTLIRGALTSSFCGDQPFSFLQ